MNAQLAHWQIVSHGEKEKHGTTDGKEYQYVLSNTYTDYVCKASGKRSRRIGDLKFISTPDTLSSRVPNNAV